MEITEVARNRFRRFLLITGIVEVVLETGSIVFVILLGYHGFAAGEMGTMLGMFSVSVLLFLLPFTLARLSAIIGLRNDKPWSYVVTLLLSALILLTSFFFTGLTAALSAPLALCGSYRVERRSLSSAAWPGMRNSAYFLLFKLSFNGNPDK